jgi:hypothetical protein
VKLVLEREGGHMRRYQGVRIGECRDFQGNHHYVEFDVDVQADESDWFVVEHPRWASTKLQPWSGYYQRTVYRQNDNCTGYSEYEYGMCKRLGYRWPDFIPPPFNPSDFVIELRY